MGPVAEQYLQECVEQEGAMRPDRSRFQRHVGRRAADLVGYECRLYQDERAEDGQGGAQQAEERGLIRGDASRAYCRGAPQVEDDARQLGGHRRQHHGSRLALAEFAEGSHHPDEKLVD